MATHSSILAQEIPWTEEPGRLQSMGGTESSTTWRLNNCHHHTEKLSTERLLNWLKLTQQGEVEWGFNAEKSEWRASV